MASKKTVYVCQQCGFEHPKWVGQCQGCGEWNSLSEELFEKSAISVDKNLTLPDPIILQTGAQFTASEKRLKTDIGEFDRVLGGGIVLGGVMLVGGSPGIGKSTLMTQVVLRLLQNSSASEIQNEPILYIAGEESPGQISLRIKRILQKEYKKQGKLSTKDLSLLEGLHFLTSPNVDEVLAYAKKAKPRLIIVDSIQTMVTDDLSGVAGSIGQVCESADRLAGFAKRHHTPVFLIGHVTKEGRVAGPMTLEHLVDAVLDLTGEGTDEVRLLRAVKNRFGATDEVGVFRMTENGFISVDNPSELFTTQHSGLSTAGSAVSCVIEGTRPLLVEVQALAVSSNLAIARRIGRGVDLSRIQVITAVLQKHCRIDTASYDIFVNVAGGYQTKEPGLDLAIAVAIASSLRDKPLPEKVVFSGEIGLLGEVRPVRLFERRKKEVQRLGYSQFVSSVNYPELRSALSAFQLD